MTALPERLAVMALAAEAVEAGARQDKTCAAISFRLVEDAPKNAPKCDAPVSAVELRSRELQDLTAGRMDMFRFLKAPARLTAGWPPHHVRDSNWRYIYTHKKQKTRRSYVRAGFLIVKDFL